MSLEPQAISALRAEVPALRQTANGRPLIFFDGPGGTQVHGTVIEAMGRYLTEANSNAHGAFLYSRRTVDTTDAARQALADFVNASSQFVCNVVASLGKRSLTDKTLTRFDISGVILYQPVG